MQLIHTIRHSGIDLESDKFLDRTAARAIVMDGEDLEVGLRRELEEETGARDIDILQHYGYLDEYRPHWKPEYDFMFMRSHFYICSTHRELGETQLESYEQANGMVPRWIRLDEAIAHNESVIKAQADSMGLSLQRETWMLKHVREIRR